MNEKINSYIDGLFRDVPPNRRVLEIREELLSNTNEKYADLLAQGMGENEAFSIVVSGVGDIGELLEDMAAIDRKNFAEAAGKNKKFSIYIAAGVFMLIASLAMMLIVSEIAGMPEVGAAIMMLMWAGAVGLIIYASMNRKKYVKKDDTFVEEYKEKFSKSDKLSRMTGAILSSFWTLITMLYFILSFWSGRWEITWIIFLVGAVFSQLISALLRKKVNAGGIIWCSAVVVYFLISFTFWNWSVSWIIFLAAAAVQQIVRLFKIWTEA